MDGAAAPPGGSVAAAAFSAAEFHRRFGGEGAAAAFAAMNGEDAASHAATAMLRALHVLIADEWSESRTRAISTALAASPAVTTLLDVLRHHRDSPLLLAATDVLEQLANNAAAQAHLAGAGAVEAVAQLLSRQPAGILSKITGDCFWRLRLLARSSEHDAALLRPHTIAVIAHALPAQPTAAHFPGGADWFQVVDIAGAVMALHLAATRNPLHVGHLVAMDAIKHAAPFEAKLNAWLVVMPEIFPAGEPLLQHSLALSARLAAMPAN